MTECNLSAQCNAVSCFAEVDQEARMSSSPMVYHLRFFAHLENTLWKHSAPVTALILHTEGHSASVSALPVCTARAKGGKNSFGRQFATYGGLYWWMCDLTLHGVEEGINVLGSRFQIKFCFGIQSLAHFGLRLSKKGFGNHRTSLWDEYFEIEMFMKTVVHYLAFLSSESIKESEEPKNRSITAVCSNPELKFLLRW